MRDPKKGNKYSKNTRLSEDAFKQVILSIAGGLTAPQTLQRLKYVGFPEVTLPTINNTRLAVADYYFEKFPPLASSLFGQKIPFSGCIIGSYVFYRSIVDREMRFSPEAQKYFALFQSSKLDQAIYAWFKNQMVSRNGIKLETFPSWFGLIGYRICLGLTASKAVQNDKDAFIHYFSDSILNDLASKPLDNKKQVYFRLSGIDDECFIIKEFLGKNLISAYKIDLKRDEYSRIDDLSSLC